MHARVPPRSEPCSSQPIFPLLSNRCAFNGEFCSLETGKQGRAPAIEQRGWQAPSSADVGGRPRSQATRPTTEVNRACSGGASPSSYSHHHTVQWQEEALVRVRDGMEEYVVRSRVESPCMHGRSPNRLALGQGDNNTRGGVPLVTAWVGTAGVHAYCRVLRRLLRSYGNQQSRCSQLGGSSSGRCCSPYFYRRREQPVGTVRFDAIGTLMRMFLGRRLHGSRGERVLVDVRRVRISVG